MNSNSHPALSQLIDEITKRNVYPEDYYEIAALLESMGWNDGRVYDAFGMEDVFVLAEELWNAIQQQIVLSSFTQQKKRSKFKLFVEMLRSFLRGLIFALPMAISVVSMLTLKFSLWSYENLSIEMATSIAIGTIISFWVVGGFTQAIARRGFFYLYQGYYRLMRKVTFYFIRLGYIACIIVSAIVYLFNLIFNIYPNEMLLITLLYLFFLNSIWLSVTVMYILRREITFTGLIVFGIFIVYLLFRIFNMDIIFAQLIAISIVSVIGMGLVVYFFKREEKKDDKVTVPKMQRLSYMIYSIVPYFMYGFLYFLFLFTDRINAWSTNQEFMPYFIWFRGDYELGLDFALLVLMIPLGISEVVVFKFMADIEASQKEYWGKDTSRFNSKFLGVYYKLVSIVTVSSLISGSIVTWVLVYVSHRFLTSSGKNLISGETTYMVFFCALAAYMILAIGLLNAVILFSLSQPGRVNRALVPAVFVNAILGFLLSRWFNYGDAVFGLVAGSIVFLVLSFRQMQFVLNKLDYYLYVML